MEPENVHSGAELERRYRRLLRAYPRGYRAERGEEMLATLLETAAPGQRRPSRVDTVDIVTGAVRERLGINAVPGFAAGLRIAGPISLALAAGFAQLGWLSLPQSTWAIMVGAVWLAAALVHLVAPERLLWAVLPAWLITVAAAAIEPPPSVMLWTGLSGGLAKFDAGDPIASQPGGGLRGWLVHLQVVMFAGQLVCGLVCLLYAATVHSRPSWAERVATILAVAAPPTLSLAFGDRTTWASAISALRTYPLVLLPIALLAVGAVTAATRRTTGVLWAALLVGIGVVVVADGPDAYLSAGGPLGVVQLDPRWLVEQSNPLGTWGLLFPLNGLVAVAPLAALVAVAVMVAAAPRFGQVGAAGKGGGNALSTLGGIALGATAGVSLYELASMWSSGGASARELAIAATPALAAIAVPLIPRWLRRPIILGALAVVVASIFMSNELSEPRAIFALALLLTIAAVSVRASAAVIGGSAIVALGLVAIIAWDVFAEYSTPPLEQVQVYAVPAVAAVVLLLAPFAGIVAVVRRRGSWISGTLVFAAGVFWMVVQLRIAEMPLILTFVAASVIALLIARLVLRPTARAVS